MKFRGPLVTLGVVAVLGVGIWLVNMSQQDDSAPTAAEPSPTTPVAAPAQTATSEPAPTTPPPPPPPAFPANADFVGEIPTGDGTIVLDIAVDGAGGQAIAYGCDGDRVEAWFWGSAENGVVTMSNKQKTSRLDGRLEGDRVVGTMEIGEKSYPFTTAVAPPPAGLYVYDEGGVRNSWIVQADGTVTGVQRRADGSTAPAPGLSTDGTAVIDGCTVTATQVQGDTEL